MLSALDIVAHCFIMSAIYPNHAPQGHIPRIIFAIGNEYMENFKNLNYSLFDVEISKEYHIVLYDGAHNKRNLCVFAMSLSDAIEQARNKALSLGFRPPYTFAKVLQYDS